MPILTKAQKPIQYKQNNRQCHCKQVKSVPLTAQVQVRSICVYFRGNLNPVHDYKGDLDFNAKYKKENVEKDNKVKAEHK